MPKPERGHGVALARAALAGNPSDGYGGAVLATTVPHFRARAEARPADAPKASPPSELVSATITRFARELNPEATKTELRWSTTIPQAVGLGGSSAIVIGALRALCELYDPQLDPDRLAQFALAVETEELGIAAGPQDRVAQAYGGLTFMDFGDPPNYEPLDPGLLPPLVIAWLPDAASPSTGVHSDLRTRAEAVGAAMTELAETAHAARAALERRDHAGFASAVDRSFDLRSSLVTLDPRHVAMIECARKAGAAANYTGSGGAVVAVCRDDAHRTRLLSELRREGSHRITV